MSWFRNLRILLTPHKVAYVLEAAIGDAPADDASEDDKKVYQSKSEDSSFVQSGMLYAMEADLQKRFEKMSAFEIISDLKAVFAPQAKAERYEASELFFSAKMEEHSLECKIPDELAIYRVLQSLPPRYKGFVMNYNMQGMAKSLGEVFMMLKTAEVEIKKEHTQLIVNKTVDFKKSGGKGKQSWKSRREAKLAAKGPTRGPAHQA